MTVEIVAGGGGGGGGGDGIVAAGGGDRVLAYSIYASCWVAFRRTFAARRGALTFKAFLCLQMAKPMMVTPARMPITTKNLNTVAG